MSTSTCLSILTICLFCAIGETKQDNFLNDADFARGRLLVQNKAANMGSTGTQNNLNKMEGDIMRRPGSNNRNAAISPSLRWPNASVPYEISPAFNQDHRARIAAAMNEFHMYSCIRFVPRTASDTDYVNIIDGTHCYSYVGRIGGAQDLSLNINSGCVQHGTIVHEMMHALGFEHEHQRPDRDEFVTINYENIQDGQAEWFAKYETSRVTTQGTPYDYASVMHYSANAFSKNEKPTIVSRRKPGEPLGQRDGLSAIDAQELNMLYKCSVPTIKPTPAPCIDKGASCSYWREQGYCNGGTYMPYMQINCRLTCGIC